MKKLIFAPAATLISAKHSGFASGVLSGIACATGSNARCDESAEDAISYISNNNIK